MSSDIYPPLSPVFYSLFPLSSLEYKIWDTIETDNDGGKSCQHPHQVGIFFNIITTITTTTSTTTTTITSPSKSISTIVTWWEKCREKKFSTRLKEQGSCSKIKQPPTQTVKKKMTTPTHDPDVWTDLPKREYKRTTDKSKDEQPK